MSTQISSVMTPDPITIRQDSTLRQIGALFHRFGFHHLLVIDEREQLVGIVSDRDYLKVISPFIDTYSERDRDTDILNRRAHSIMSRHPKTGTPDMLLEQANHFFVEHKVSCMPIVDEQKKVLGILTLRDILKWNDLHLKDCDK